MSTKAANRYARAFLETANELDLLESVREDMLLISNTFSSSPDLGLFLRSPIVRGEKKRAALIEIFRDQIQEITSHLLSVLTRKSRERLLEEIATQFLKLYNQQKGIVDVHVVSARKLSEQQKKQLINELQGSVPFPARDFHRCRSNREVRQVLLLALWTARIPGQYRPQPVVLFLHHRLRLLL